VVVVVVVVVVAWMGQDKPYRPLIPLEHATNLVGNGSNEG
jgi:hypothetical protein